MVTVWWDNSVLILDTKVIITEKYFENKLYSQGACSLEQETDRGVGEADKISQTTAEIKGKGIRRNLS